MIIQLDAENWMAVGTVTRDAEMRTVGAKQTPITAFSVAAGKRKDTTTIFVECKAWRELAKVAATLHKGDSVCMIGKIEEREYNGKTYKDLVCEWLWAAIPSGGKRVEAPAYVPMSAKDLMDADSDMPF